MTVEERLARLDALKDICAQKRGYFSNIGLHDGIRCKDSIKSALKVNLEPMAQFFTEADDLVAATEEHTARRRGGHYRDECVRQKGERLIAKSHFMTAPRELSEIGAQGDFIVRAARHSFVCLL